MNEEANGFAEALETGMKRADEQDIEKLVSALSHCSAILDWPPEIVAQLLKIGPIEFRKIQKAVGVVLDNKIDLPITKMAEVLDMARVARIMEEEPEPAFGVTGPTGPVGAIGPTGPQGISGRTQTISVSSRDAIEEFKLAAMSTQVAKKSMQHNQTQRYRGGIRGPHSPRRC